MVCDRKQKEIVKRRSEGDITNNVLWRCWKRVIEVLATKRTDCLVWHSVQERPALSSLLWSTASQQIVVSVVETPTAPSGSCPWFGYSLSGTQYLIYSLNLYNSSFQPPAVHILHSLDSAALVTSQGKMETTISSFQSFLKSLSTSAAPPVLTPLGRILLSLPPSQAFMVPPVHYCGPCSRCGIGPEPLLSQNFLTRHLRQRTDI